MRKLLSAAAAAVVSAGVLTGCGGSDDYCSSLEDTVEEFEAFGEADFDQFGEAIDAFRDVGAEAPSEVEEEWETLISGIDSAESALQDAGAGFEDLGDIQTGQIPDGVDEEELIEALASFQELSSEEFAEAGQAIEEHAESECDVTLP
ncbi:MAG: hypothetical protein M3419_10780 [Actinomycetota bacterium]|nr:hypothetical protein [Actinomycetota bacterium]